MSSEEEWVDVGFLPATVLSDTDEPYWVKASLNTETGDVRKEPIDEDEIEEAEDNLVNLMEQHDIITAEEAEDVLGV